MHEVCSDQRQQVLSLETEVENYRKSTTQEQERNEKLTLMLNKVGTGEPILSFSAPFPATGRHCSCGTSAGTQPEKA